MPRCKSSTLNLTPNGFTSFGPEVWRYVFHLLHKWSTLQAAKQQIRVAVHMPFPSQFLTCLDIPSKALNWLTVSSCHGLPVYFSLVFGISFLFSVSPPRLLWPFSSSVCHIVISPLPLSCVSRNECCENTSTPALGGVGSGKRHECSSCPSKAGSYCL